jgi:hypothetical protein
MVKGKLARASLFLLSLSILLLVVLTAFESVLTGMPPLTERLVTFLMLVLPAAVGAGLGLLSLARAEGRVGMAACGILLNTLFALFHLMILLFAG